MSNQSSLGSGPTPDAPNAEETDARIAELEQWYVKSGSRGKHLVDDIAWLTASLRSALSDLAAARSLLRDATRDTERLDWMEAHDYGALCWNVSDDIKHDRWAAPMKPNNGWTIGVAGTEEDDGDDPQGDTLRDAIDWAIKCCAALSAAPIPETSEPHD